MGTPAKKKVFTFSSGVKVYAQEINGEMFPLEFKSEVACDKFSYKLFMKDIHTTMIKSFNDPKKFYLQIIDNII